MSTTELPRLIAQAPLQFKNVNDKKSNLPYIYKTLCFKSKLFVEVPSSPIFSVELSLLNPRPPINIIPDGEAQLACSDLIMTIDKWVVYRKVS